MRTPRIISSFLVAVSAITASVAQGSAPEMVKPETLEQGFVLIVKDESGNANKDNPIYLASSINGWNPADPEYKLTGRSDTRWQIIIDEDLSNMTMQFKFTLGGWDREEVDVDGESIGNRSLPLVDISELKDGERPVIEFSIPNFRVPVPLSEQVRSSGVYRTLDVTGDVRRVEVRGGAGGAEASTRDLLVWLPPEYDAPKNAQRRYPVLYMFDGQNLFEQLQGVPGEWRVDETATELINAGRVEPVIIVGIPHSGAHRLAEFLPVGSFQGTQGEGAKTMRWITREVMPKINRAFRTQTGRENTAIGGASLGGAMALYASTMMPDTFGSALIESLPLLTKDAFERELKQARGWPAKAFVGVGGSETSTDGADSDRNRAYVEWSRTVESMIAGEVGADSTLFVVKDDAVHNENAWAERFPEALEFLFPAR